MTWIVNALIIYILWYAIGMFVLNLLRAINYHLEKKGEK